jgi:hypothetical protein
MRELEALNRPIDELLLLEDIQGMSRSVLCPGCFFAPAALNT